MATVGALAALLVACASGEGLPGDRRGDGGSSDGGPPEGGADAFAALDGGPDAAVDGAAPSDAAPDAPPPPDERAFLHANLWSVWWNDRTRCGAERTFLEICQRRDEDCARYQASVDACDPNLVVYGQVGPEKEGERLCQRGPFPDFGGCDSRDYDFSRLGFWWYGAEWAGNWPVATLKVFEAGGGGDATRYLGDGLAAASNLPHHAQAAMASVDNHGLDADGDGAREPGACVMPGATSGDAAYRAPFGGVAWLEVPTDRSVTIVSMASNNFGDMSFAGCSRGAGVGTLEPWIDGAPGSILGCVYAEDVRFRPGTHYYFRYGRIEELPTAGPPAELVEAFARPEVGLDISTREACLR